MPASACHRAGEAGPVGGQHKISRQAHSPRVEGGSAPKGANLWCPPPFPEMAGASRRANGDDLATAGPRFRRKCPAREG